jgi:hypothetical protein
MRIPGEFQKWIIRLEARDAGLCCASDNGALLRPKSWQNVGIDST